MYPDDEFLALSGIQHFAFCRRQWGLIHVEELWEDNLLTTLGDIMHTRAHDEGIRERRGNILVVRGMTVRSPLLGIWGKCDVVEFKRSSDGHPLFGEDGLWLPVPVEYKRGRSKMGDEDRLQLCAQAMCLEDMFACDLCEGFLYYGKTRSREHVSFTPDLRQHVKSDVAEMHRLYARGCVPRVKPGAKCRSCSLVDMCMPKTQAKSVEKYMREMMDDTS